MRALKILVVVMGVLIVGGTLALVMVLVQRVGGGSSGSGRWETALEQPEGTRITGIAATESGLGVLVARPDGERVLLVEPKRGRVVGEIRPGR